MCVWCVCSPTYRVMPPHIWQFGLEEHLRFKIASANVRILPRYGDVRKTLCLNYPPFKSLMQIMAVFLILPCSSLVLNMAC